jgi:hypothetical protein
MTQSVTFMLVYAAGIYLLQLTPDAKELLAALRKKSANP